MAHANHLQAMGGFNYHLRQIVSIILLELCLPFLIYEPDRSECAKCHLNFTSTRSQLSVARPMSLRVDFYLPLLYLERKVRHSYHMWESGSNLRIVWFQELSYTVSARSGTTAVVSLVSSSSCSCSCSPRWFILWNDWSTTFLVCSIFVLLSFLKRDIALKIVSLYLRAFLSVCICFLMLEVHTWYLKVLSLWVSIVIFKILLTYMICRWFGIFLIL